MLYVIAASFRKLPKTQIKVLCELIAFWDDRNMRRLSVRQMS
jgi:hypothetical protein